MSNVGDMSGAKLIVKLTFQQKRTLGNEKIEPKEGQNKTANPLFATLIDRYP